MDNLQIYGDKSHFSGSFEDDGSHGGHPLFACPFCGTDTDLELCNTHTPSYWVSCNNCGAEAHGQCTEEGGSRIRSKKAALRLHLAAIKSAVLAWNTRAGTPTSEDKRDGKHSPTPTLDSKARIVDNCLIIRVPIETLAFAAQNSDHFFDAAENGEVLVISDQSNFAESVARALNVEAEDGSTPVTRMLDKATEWVVEQGDEGIDFLLTREDGQYENL